jgi:heme-degrading monooxygenase HmoA
MLVVIIDFPPIREGKETEFLEWFAWSNREFSKQRGFINRRLLKPLTGTNFAVLLEIENREALASLQSSAFHNEAAGRVGPLLDGSPAPQLYEVVS